MNEKMIEQYEKEKDPEFQKRALIADQPIQINKNNTRELKYVQEREKKIINKINLNKKLESNDPVKGNLQAKKDMY